MARYWAVQPYRPGGRVRAMRPCADFCDVIAKIHKFRSTNTDPDNRLRVYVPIHTPDNERREIIELGVEVI
jgi:hypothetical protein